MYAGGLRINGTDTGNTFYQNAINIGTYPANIGFTLRDDNTFNFNSLSSTGGGYTNILNMNTSGIALNKNTAMNATALTIPTGSLGIGTYPSYPLQVNGGSTRTQTNVFVRTGYYGGNDYNTGSITAYISAAFDNSLYVGGLIMNSSDIRIKKEIKDVDDDGALQQILLIQPKTYKYIDEITRGSSVVYGFIAQQIKEVIPEAVELAEEYIPNIYKIATTNESIINLDYFRTICSCWIL